MIVAFISNLHQSKIDPNTIEEKKMIAKIIAGLVKDDKFDLKQENIIDFKDNLEEAVNVFCYSCVAHTILTKL